MQFQLRFFIVLACWFPIIACAQTTDTLARKDSTARHANHQVLPAAFKPASYILPASLVTYGSLSFAIKGIRNIDYHVYDAHQRHNPNFSTHVDNYTQYAPAAAVYALNLAGIEGKHRFVDRTFLLLLSEGFAGGAGFIAKRAITRERPDHSDFESFPSGHTMRAFAAAQYLSEEYGDVSPWYSAAGYVTAAGTGVLRLYNNKHWLSDVVAGAGAGIVATKLAYFIYPYLKRELWHDQSPKALLMPTYHDGVAGFALLKQF